MNRIYKSNHILLVTVLSTLTLGISTYFTISYGGRNVMTYLPGAILFYYLFQFFSKRTLRSFEVDGKQLKASYFSKPFKKEVEIFPLESLRYQLKLKGFSRSGSRWFSIFVFNLEGEYLFQLYDDWFLWQKSDIDILKKLLIPPND